MSSLAKWWPKVQRNPVSGCWLHPGAPSNRAGHVHVVYLGQRLYAHRLVYILTHGPAAAGKVVRHICDDPACVNPDHLLIGTQRDNVYDAIARNRRNAFGRQRLIASDIPGIRARYAAGELQKDIAKSLGVSKGCIHAVVHHQTWGYVPGELGDVRLRHTETLQPNHQNRNCNFVAEVLR